MAQLESSRFIWTRTGLAVAGIAIAALLVWPLAGAAWSLAVALAGLVLMLWLHLANLHALAQWLRDPQEMAPPLGSGVWEPVFSALHRYVRGERDHQRRLAVQLARFRNAGQATPDAVIILDAENHIEWCNNNAERYFGIDCRRDAGQKIANLVRHPDFISFIAHGRWDEPLLLRIARPQPLALAVSIVPYGQDELLLLARDVTQAERVDTMRRDFVANVSHELKTPLTVVSGFIETLADNRVASDSPRGRQVLGLMREQADRMLRVIEDLLMLSTLESSAAPATEAPIDVGTLLVSLTEEARALSDGRHRIESATETDARLLGNEQELHSAFSNLVSNAVRYTPAGGAITLTWRERGGEGVFTVADTGIGIEPEHIPRLTERFYRVDRGRSRESGGTGLGLAIVKHVLSRHQATIEVESRLGEGSRFSAVFPPRRLQRTATTEPDEAARAAESGV